LVRFSLGAAGVRRRFQLFNVVWGSANFYHPQYLRVFCLLSHCTGYTQRHENELVDLLAKYCTKLIPEQCQVTKEQFVVGGSGAEAVVAPVAIDGSMQHDQQRRRGGQAGVNMDLVVKVGNKECWIDAAVLDPGCNTYLAKGSVTSAGTAAKTREADKRNHLKHRKPDFDMEGVTPKFIPFVVEVFGKLGESAQQFIC
jgi:hypothetical protein